MNPVFLKQLQSQEDLFLTKLVEQKNLLTNLTNFNAGESTVLNELIINFKNKVNPMIEMTLNKLVEIGKENMILQSRYENANNQALLFQNVFNEISNYLGSLQTNYTQLWSITAALANLLVKNNKDNNLLKSSLMDFAEHKKQLLKRVRDLESKILTYEKREKWIYQEMEDLFAAPDLLINAKNSFESLKEIVHNENQVKFDEFKNTIDNLNKKIEEIQNEADGKHKIDEEEKENLKNEIENMRNKINSNEEEKKQIEEEKRQVEEKHKNYESEMNKVIEKAKIADVLNSAINSFCDLYGFIYFDGLNITVKTGEFNEKNALEISFEAMKNENQKLKKEIQKLEISNQEITSKFQSDIDTIKINSSREIHLLKNALESAYESRDNLYNDYNNLELQIKQTSFEKQKLEQQIKVLQKQNQDLKIKNQTILEHEKQMITKYDENLSILSKVKTESQFIPEIKLPSLDNADDIYKEANETLNKKIANLEKEKLELNCKIETITQDNKNLMESKDKLSLELEHIQKKELKDISEIKHWKDMYESIVNSTQSNEKQKQQEKTYELEKENQRYNEEHEKNILLDKEINKLRTKNKELNEKCEKISSLEERVKNLGNENKELNEKCEKIALYEERIENLRTKNEELNEKCVRITLLEEKNKKLKEENEKLKKKESDKEKTSNLITNSPSQHTESPEIQEPDLNETRDLSQKEEPRRNEENSSPQKKQSIPKAQTQKPIPKPRIQKKSPNSCKGKQRK